MKFTKENFAYFVNRFRYWQDYLGLSDWNIQIPKELENGGDFHAYVTASVEDMRAWVVVSDDWERTDKQFIDETACHEVLEVMFSRVEELGDARYVREGEIRAAIHAEINRLVRKLCQKQ